MDREKMALIAGNVFKAHKQAIEEGLFDWSMANYLRYELGYVHLLKMDCCGLTCTLLVFR